MGEPFVVHPRMVRIHAAVWSVVLIAFFVLGFFAFPPEIRALFTPFQLATLLAILAIFLGAMWAVASASVRADADGLTYRNGVATHTSPWADVASIRFADGDPWAFVLLHDEPYKRALMGIMRSDGARAHAAVERLAGMHAVAKSAD